jgi:RNA polymerase sigma factor (sigma-70 family)
LRRGGQQQRLNIDDVELAAEAADDQLLAVDEALQQLAAIEPQKAELVKLRYFGGLTMEETSEILGISLATAKRWWTYARAWLYEQTRGGGPSKS